MVYRRCMHFRKPGTESDFQCGGHVRTKARPFDGADVTDVTALVDCFRCQQSKPFKAAAKVARAKSKAEEKARKERNSKMAAAGFDPHKPLGDWTREEVEAYVAWRDSQKGMD